jgi:hypothetical protein
MECNIVTERGSFPNFKIVPDSEVGSPSPLNITHLFSFTETSTNIQTDKKFKEEKFYRKERDPLTDTIDLFCSGEITVPYFVYTHHSSVAQVASNPCQQL